MTEAQQIELEKKMEKNREEAASILRLRNNIRLGVRVLATAGLLFTRFYFGPIGAGTGVVDGLIIAAIWICREPDTK